MSCALLMHLANGNSFPAATRAAADIHCRSVENANDNGMRTVYAPMRSIEAERGQRVEGGEVIGLRGYTSRRARPHLYYEARVGGRSVDPVRFGKSRHAFQALSQG